MAARNGSAPRHPLRSLVLRVVAVGALLAALGVAIAGLVPSARPHLRHAALGWVAVEVVLELVACGSYALLFHGVFSHGAHRFRRIRGAQIGLGELSAFAITPTGAGGPALRIWALLRLGMPFRVQMTRSVIHGAILNIPYVVVAVLLGLGVAFGVGLGHAQLALALAPLGLVLASVSVAAVAVLLARRGSGRPRAGWRRILREVIEAVPAGLRELPDRLREGRLLLFALGYWAGDCGVLIVAFHSAHGAAPVGVIVLAYLLGQLGNTLPLPGGVGAVEPAMLGVLTSSGVPLGLGAAAIVLYRFVSLGLQAVVGVVAAATLVPALQREGPS